MRCHHDRGSEDFRGLSSRAEGVSLRIGSVGLSRSAAPRAGVRSGKLGRELRSFSRTFHPRSESSVVRSRVRCICSRCSSICRSRLSMYRSRSSRSSCIVPSPPYLLAPPGLLCTLLSLSCSGSGLCPLQLLRSHADKVECSETPRRPPAVLRTAGPGYPSGCPGRLSKGKVWMIANV
jgi:hypothetical protein